MDGVFIGLGSNLGDRFSALQRAVAAIAQLPTTTIKKISSVYETEPVGVKHQGEFFNAVVEVETELAVQELFASLKEIEHALGRTHHERWGPREIDLDLLYMGSLIIDNSALRIPHPELHHRKFVLIPFVEIAPEFIDPLRRTTVRQLFEQTNDESMVKQTSLRLVNPKEL
jgi:2-amino-4-hydroxy-6-hydroxymethyldihydropteridine diphosphokinase